MKKVMTKVRVDVALIAILLFILVNVGNYFSPVEQGAYEKAEPSSYEIGMPADDSITVVSTVKELEKAQKKHRNFAIKVEKDKLTQTDYYYSNTYRDNGAFKSNPVVMSFRYAFEDETYDRIYVAELEDGNRILVRLFERALDLSDDTLILPIGEKIIYKDSYSPFEKINETIELTTEDATKWYVDASGYYFRQHYLMDKVSASDRSWGIIIGGIVIYMIVSTVFLVMHIKRNNAA